MPTPDDTIRETLLDDVVQQVHCDLPTGESEDDALARVRNRLRAVREPIGPTVEQPDSSAKTERAVSFLRRHAMKLALAAAASIAIAIISTLPVGDGTSRSIAFADVVQQIRSARRGIRKRRARSSTGHSPGRIRPPLMRSGGSTIVR